MYKLSFNQSTPGAGTTVLGCFLTLSVKVLFEEHPSTKINNKACINLVIILAYNH
jgi:hypothetical protein